MTDIPRLDVVDNGHVVIMVDQDDIQPTSREFQDIDLCGNADLC
jgi:hypothetical protein